MPETARYIGLDVHKASISVSVAEEGRDGEVVSPDMYARGAGRNCHVRPVVDDDRHRRENVNADAAADRIDWRRRLVGYADA